MKTASVHTCDVSEEVPRVDLIHKGVLYRGAALHGAGGIMGGASARGWTAIAARVAFMARRRETLIVYVQHRRGDTDTVKVPAAEVQIVKVYPPRARS